MIMIVETGLKLIEARNFCDLIQFCFLFYSVIFEGRDEGGGGAEAASTPPLHARSICRSLHRTYVIQIRDDLY